MNGGGENARGKINRTFRSGDGVGTDGEGSAAPIMMMRGVCRRKRWRGASVLRDCTSRRVGRVRMSGR